MSDDGTAGDDRTDHPDTTAAGLHRRAFVQGAGALGVTGLAGVASARGESVAGPDGDARGRDRSWSNERAMDKYPDIVAHRGFAGLYPENTVGAVRAATRGLDTPLSATHGADAVEIDVMPTADGDVVAFHDDGLAERDGGERRLTDAEGLVWETDTETVTSAEVLNSGETVPLLTEIFDAIPRSVEVNVELKNPGSADLEFGTNLADEALSTQKEIWRPFVQDVLDIVEDVRHDILFSSFYEGALATTREASEYPVAPLLWNSVEDGVAIAREYDVEAIHPPYNMIQETPFYRDDYVGDGEEWADVSIVDTATEEGWRVNVFTLGTWYQAEQLAAAGVDGLIADYPGLLWAGSR